MQRGRQVSFRCKTVHLRHGFDGEMKRCFERHEDKSHDRRPPRLRDEVFLETLMDSQSPADQSGYSADEDLSRLGASQKAGSNALGPPLSATF